MLRENTIKILNPTQGLTMGHVGLLVVSGALTTTLLLGFCLCIYKFQCNHKKQYQKINLESKDYEQSQHTLECVELTITYEEEYDTSKGEYDEEECNDTFEQRELTYNITSPYKEKQVHMLISENDTTLQNELRKKIKNWEIAKKCGFQEKDDLFEEIRGVIKRRLEKASERENYNWKEFTDFINKNGSYMPLNVTKFSN